MVQAQWAYREKWGSLTMKQIFDKMDSDHDGVVTESELYSVSTSTFCMSERAMSVLTVVRNECAHSSTQ